ncbi:cob(I)alamin adenosyltransferase [Thermosulfidibacter takaii ABI70S6]|uniref:corrinoid adenosyltransferase n=1 Tax=Thermosulfidibacter takaii (strain DSM 17441 / JCM 13301 / NBRC 103674 / ABI70S6) TaxID=1298851 RepID=A0A0S3QU29_THET7|nr:cob(I)yrinic acid a,c-diamide adenosyltransferase [Thermosulfidibacter takaii]BAT71815.1 cob(I)alamin adenosyltransferase [Thermosulfidibacter takaii ABI70S6]
MKKLKEGYVQVYTGDGKGKTTAALGLAFRAVGHGMKVFIIQFMKGSIFYGELKTAEMLAPYVTIVQMGREEFVNRENPDPKDVELAQKGIALAKEIMEKNEHDILILDEINVALDFGLVTLEQVLDLIDNKPKDMELVLTGRYAHPEVIKKADLVTEMIEIRHYYNEKGVDARDGIER